MGTKIGGTYVQDRTIPSGSTYLGTWMDRAESSVFISILAPDKIMSTYQITFYLARAQEPVDDDLTFGGRLTFWEGTNYYLWLREEIL